MARLRVEMHDVSRVADLQVFIDLLALLGIDEYGDHPARVHAGSAHLSVSMPIDSILPLPERSDDTKED